MPIERPNRDALEAYTDQAIEDTERALEEDRAELARQEALANKPWYESLWDETKNTAEWAYDEAGKAWDFVSATANDVLDAYYKLGAEREAFLKRGADLQQAYSPEAVAEAQETGDYSAQQQAFASAQEQAAETQTAMANVPRSFVRQAARTLIETYDDTDDDGAFGSLIESIKQSDANIEYFMTDAEKLQKARDIEAATGIKAEAFLGDTKAYKQAMEIYDFKRKLEKAGGDPDKIYEEYPELKSIVDMDPASAAIALHELESIKSTHGTIETFDYMLQQGRLQLEYDNLMYKVAMGKATENDLQRANDLKWQIENSQKKTPSFLDDPLAAIAAGIAGSTPGMYQAIMEGLEDFAITEAAFTQAGAAAGAAVGGVGAAPGAAAGASAGVVKSVIASIAKNSARRELIEAGARQFLTGQVAKSGGSLAFKLGMFSGMQRQMVGESFSDYKDLKDENGNPLLSNEAARNYALASGSAQAGIEMMNFGLIKNALIGRPHANRIIGDIVNDAQSKMVARESARNIFKQKVGDTLKITASEAGEEGLQSITDDLVHNQIAADTQAKTVKSYSAQDILTRAAASAAMAIPASIGFGLMGTMGGSVTNTIRNNRVQKNLAKAQALYGDNARQTLVGTLMMEQLQQTVAESKLAKNSPDIQTKVLREQLKQTQFQTSYIDVEMALKKENGMNDLKEVAKAANLSNEELQTAIDQKGHILVPSETLAQVKASPELLDAVSFDAAAPSMARMRETSKEVMQEVEKRTEKAINKQVELINGIVNKYYPTDDKGRQNASQRDMMTAAIYTNINNPAAGWKALRKEQQDQLDDILAPAIKALQDGFGKAGLGEIEDEQGNKKTVYTSDNDQWYRDWYKEHKHQPTKKELQEMAIAIVTGDPSAPKVQGWVPTTAEEQAAFEANRADVEKLQQDIAVLDEIKGNMKELTGVEMRLTEGLSAEGYDVYRQVYDYLKKIRGGVAVQARMGALLTARHADIYASIISKQTGKKYTAMDYMRDTLGFDTKPSEGGLKQMAGETAENANIDKLVQAENLEKQGASMDDIYKETGWAKGQDGKWRFEIPDNLNKIDFSVYKKGNKDSKTRYLRYVYDNPKLYEAYPWLGIIPVSLKDMGDSRSGAASRINGDYKITLNEKKSDISNAKTLIHEIQHIIQSEERFAVGGSPESVRQQIRQEETRLRKKLADIPHAQEYFDANNELLEALFASTDENAINRLWEKVDKLNNALPDKAQKEVENISAMLAQLHEAQQNKNDYALYYDLAGEQEARTVEKRAVLRDILSKTRNEETARKLKNDLEKKPIVHGENAVIVFGGQEYSAEQEPVVREVYIDGAKYAIKEYATGVVTNGKTIENKSLVTAIRMLENIGNVDKVMELLDVASKSHIKGKARYAKEALDFLQGKDIKINTIKLERPKQELPVKPPVLKDEEVEEIRKTYGPFDGEGYNPRSKVPKVRGGWTEKKILSYLKAHGTLHGVRDAVRLIAEFDSVEELKSHMFFHGSPGGASALKPSITMSKREIGRIGGGGYGERYWGISVTPNKKIASNFSGDKSHINIYPIILAKNAIVEENPKLKDAEDIEPQIVDYWTRGVDAVWIGDKNDGEQELLVLNPRAIVNLDRADTYQVFKLGTKENPLTIKNDEEIAKMLNVAKSLRGEKGDYKYDSQETRNTIFFQTAWHGTPHDFEKFDLGAIGTGEGAQAHGWGLYFAANRKISEDYKAKLSNKVVIYKGEEIPLTSISADDYKKLGLNEAEDKALLAIMISNNLKEALEDLTNDLKLAERNHDIKEIDTIKQAIKIVKNDVEIKGGKLFEVEIPDNDVLLDEQKPFSEQPEKVQRALRKLISESKTAQKHTAFAEQIYKANGKKIYGIVVGLAEGDAPRNANFNNTQRLGSELLNKYGIKGITYEGGRDGRCFVVFDDKAISVIERYNQMVAEKNQDETLGFTDFYQDGRRIVSILENANESTFVHELGHVFLDDLQKLAEIDETSAKELEIVNAWAEWHKGDAEKYRPTSSREKSWYKEFRQREQAIIDAEAAGDHDTADRLKREWKHERFARAFELYLRDGQAPAKGLKEVFRKFKTFLKQVYMIFTADGARASEPVKRIMDRMIASEEEIEQASLEDRYKDITAAGGSKLLEETEEKTYKRFYKEAEAESKEKLMAIVMDDLEDARKAEFDRRIMSEEARKRKELQQETVYLAEQAVLLSGGNEDIVSEWYPSVEAFRKELAETKPLEDALKEWMDKYKDELDAELIESHFSEENIEKCMQKPKYREKMEVLKATALTKKLSLINSINAKAKTAIGSIEDKLMAMPDDMDLKVNKSSDSVKAIMKAINELRFAARWTPSEYRHIESMIRANTQEDIRQALKAFKEQAKENKENEQAVLKANEGKMQLYKELAKSSIMKKNLADACNYGNYVREQKIQARRVQQMINAKRFDMAIQAQQQQAFAAAMANESKKMQEKVQKLLNAVKRQLNTRSVRLPKDERYWHRHLSYILRLTNTDAKKPKSGVMKLEDIFSSMKESLDLQYSPIDIMEISAEDEDFKGYKSLTFDQFEDAVEALTVLYTTGRDKFRMKTIGGRDIADVVKEITLGSGIKDRVRTTRDIINDDKGGLGYNGWLGKIPGIGQAMAERGQKYLAVMLKPEEILKALGPAAHKYIFGIYDKAREAENKMIMEEMRVMRDILKDYSDAEKRAWKKKNIKFRTGQTERLISKENVICMALNMGNKANIQRICGGFGTEIKEIESFLQEHMTKKDWGLVQNIWDHLNSYWEQTVEVEEKLNGVALQKVEAVPFTAKTKDGEEIKLNGGYYPIKYNPKKSSKAEEQDINQAAMGVMSGAQVLGTNRGFTKSRADVDINRPILLEFGVITEHLQNVIHNINYRIPARDVYRLVNSQAFEDHVRNTLGAPYHTLLKQWATDVWNQPKDQSNMAGSFADDVLGFLRRNSVMSIMGYNLWATIENISNIAPAMDQLGATKALEALSKFYFNYEDSKGILKKSIFMMNRINSMDRDISAQEGLFEVGLPVFDIIKRHAYDMMLYSDLMVSAPLWVQSYKDAFPVKVDEVRRETQANIKALHDAQMEVDEIKAAINDAEKEAAEIDNHMSIRESGTPDQIEQEKLSPFAIHKPVELRAMSHDRRNQAFEKRKELYKAEDKLNRAMELDIYSDDELIKEAERRAVAAADAVIRDTFGSGATMDLSSLQRNKNGMVKLMTTFYSFFNTQFNAIYREYMRGKFGPEEINAIRRWAPFAKKIMYRVVLVSLIGSLLKFALGLDGNDDRDKYITVKDANGKEKKVEVPAFQRFLNVFGKNMLSTAAGGLIGVRDVANLAINYLFDGTTYGRSFNPFSAGFSAVEEFGKMFDLIARKGKKDLEIQAQEEKREREWKERLKKLKGKKKAEAIKKHEEDEKYRKPVKRITYSEAARHGMLGISRTSAAYTGLTSTLVDSITGTMQYLNDADGRYDPAWKNIIWSALFNKKPVERVVPEKPPAPPKPAKKRRRRKGEKNN